MQHIHSKDIFMLIRDTLKLYDRRLMDHGSKVAYYVYKMLQCKGGYEEYELADIVFLVTFHDIGAYKTENINEMLRFETKDYAVHTLYGYLFIKNLTSIGEMAKVILYHHTDYSQLEKMNFEYKDLVSYVNIAEKIDIFSESVGDKFNMEFFQKWLGTKISPEAYELFMKANHQYDLFGKIKSKEYKKELEELTGYFILTNEDKERLLELLMYTLAFKSEMIITDAVTTLIMSEIIGMKMGLEEEQLKLLRYASYVHDIGMMAVPKAWIEAQGKLTLKEAEKMKQHVLLSERLLQDRMKKEVIFIAAAHHEHTNGSGYPRKLIEKQMNISQMILQFADAVSVLITPRPNRASVMKETIIEMVETQTEAGIYNKAVARIFLESYDEVIDYTKNKSKEVLAGYRKLNLQFANALAKRE